MPFGFPAFPASSGKPRVPEDPNHPYWKQQAKNANPPPQQYKDSPRSSMSKEKEVLVEDTDETKRVGAGGATKEKKEREKTNWALMSESRSLSR